MDETQESLGLGAPSSPDASYRVLARKYRPTDFTGLIGQEALVRTLSNAFSTGRIAHAFMLTGVRGVGKTTTARIIARALNCIGPAGTLREPTIKPCGVCEPCVAISESRHVDVLEMDAASHTGIDDVREIVEGVRYAPASARYKVYIVDEVHMLSKQAFNGLLKTLEEPPPHVKFVFATTEVRKVPVTVLSRCQRFDLRRIETGELARYLNSIAARENVAIEPAAVSLVARAAEGSVRDGLSLLDQAVAHSSESTIAAEAVRQMLGLADRGRVLDLFEQVMAGRTPDALAGLSELYDRGADPLTIMQDLLEIVHFLTRLKVAPAAEGFFDGGSGEASRAASLALRLSVPTLTRAWQLLLKGLFEVRDAARPIQAAEMVLVRLAHAADLPPTDKLVRDLLDEKRREPSPATRSQPSQVGAGPRAAAIADISAVADLSERPQAVRNASPTTPQSLQEIAQLAEKNGAMAMKVQIENYIHLVHIEPGRIEFRPDNRAPATLAGDLAKKLRDWTGTRWVVSLAREGGMPTLAVQKKQAQVERFEGVLREPMVRAVLDRFPGAQVVAVRKVDDDAVAGTSEDIPETGSEK